MRDDEIVPGLNLDEPGPSPSPPDDATDVDTAPGGPKATPAPRAVATTRPAGVDFPQAILEISVGHKMTRVAWGDDGIYIFLQDDRLRLRKSAGTVHDLIVSGGDIQATDWVIARLH